MSQISIICGGRRVIRPEQFRSLDPAEYAIPYGSSSPDSRDSVQKYRDVLKSAVIMADSRETCMILGIENQETVNYAMPVRNLVYDALQYEQQVREISRSHKKKQDYWGRSPEEYLSGFYAEDRLKPVITLVVYYGADE